MSITINLQDIQAELDRAIRAEAFRQARRPSEFSNPERALAAARVLAKHAINEQKEPTNQ